MNASQVEFRRQLVCAIAAQRSRVITLADSFGERLRAPGTATERFVKQIWEFATAIVEGEPEP